VRGFLTRRYRAPSTSTSNTIRSAGFLPRDTFAVPAGTENATLTRALMSSSNVDDDSSSGPARIEPVQIAGLVVLLEGCNWRSKCLDTLAPAFADDKLLGIHWIRPSRFHHDGAAGRSRGESNTVKAHVTNVG
jgi:hypothetical protein